MTPSVDNPQLHPTTECCLEVLQSVAASFAPQDILDVGCGSGLLSIVSAGLWENAKLLATDIAPQAILDTQRLCHEHGMDKRVSIIRSDGLNNDTVRSCAPYDLIICNLLAEPIIAWAPDMRAHLRVDGLLLLSGILAWFAADVTQSYEKLGFEVIHTISRSPWTTLLLQRSEL